MLKPRITSFDIATFLRQLSTFINAGIPIGTSLSFLAQSQIKSKLGALIADLHHDIQIGHAFSTILEKYPMYFSASTCQLVKIGEHTGKFDALLTTIATYQEKNLLFKKRIMQALFYPFVLVLFAAVVTLTLLYFIVPHFAILFQEVTDVLPLLTRLIFFLAKLLHQYLLLFVCGTLMSIVYCLYKIDNIEHMKKILWRHFPEWPICRYYFLQLALARFSRHLALTYTAGLPIIKALPLSAAAADHQRLSLATTAVIQEVRLGIPLSEAMGHELCFSKLFLQFIKIGEETGKLDTMLDKYADIAETQLDTLIQRLNVLLEPLIMLCLGVLIGGLVVGMYLPLFKLGSVL